MLKTFEDYGIILRSGSSGEVKTQCPQCSSSRKKKNVPCLNVNVEKGLWNCWHCSWGGTLKAGEHARPELRKVYTRPDFIAQSTPTAIEEWFATRGITPEVLKRNMISAGKAYFPQTESEQGCIMFPYFRGSEVINIKYRTRDKHFRMAAGAERVLYGLNDVQETLIWVEGEIDKLSLDVAGFQNCVSVPDGAPAVETKNYSSKFDYLDAPELEKVQKHIIAVDMDGPGQALEKELVRRLGADRCWVVRWDGYKDANEVLTGSGPDAIGQAIAEARQVPITGSHTLSEFEEDFITLYEKGSQKGLSTGWAEVDQLYTVRTGDMTVVTGIPNSGKSEWVDALMVNMAKLHGHSFGVFSAENWPITEHGKKLAEKFIGKPFSKGPTPSISRTELDVATTWISKHFHFVQPESPTIDSILSVMRQLVLRHGIRGMVIDPWNEIESSRPEGMSETEYIGQVLSEIRRFSRLHGLNAWIVAHPTKLRKDDDGNYPVPTPYDISGSANWRNKADNCIAVWRDLSPESNYRMVEIHIQKIRHKSVGVLGKACLNYDWLTGRYFGSMLEKSPYQSMTHTVTGEIIEEEIF